MIHFGILLYLPRRIRRWYLRREVRKFRWRREFMYQARVMAKQAREIWGL